MKYDIPAYIIYYVEPIAICQENLLLLLLDVGAQQEEVSAPFAGELLTALREAGGVVSIRIVVVGEAPAAASVSAVAAQPFLQGQEKRLTHYRLTRRKSTVRLTKMLSNSMQALQREEGVSVKARSRLLTRSRGLL
jgi:alkylated DNA nucleotide flippase Atl1